MRKSIFFAFFVCYILTDWMNGAFGQNFVTDKPCPLCKRGPTNQELIAYRQRLGLGVRQTGIGGTRPGGRPGRVARRACTGASRSGH